MDDDQAPRVETGMSTAFDPHPDLPTERAHRPAPSPFDAPDAVHRVGPYLVRRARPDDALAYCLADAEMVAGSYPGVMPEQWSRDRLEEAEGLVPGRAAAFAENLATEARGEEPDDRTWLALSSDGSIVGICVSRATPQDWEAINDVRPIPGVTHQLNHLYLRPAVQGTGLADALMDLALPGRMPAYLWIIGGNERGRRFYARHGFVGDGVTYSCGPIWYDMPLFRMYRRA
ncbi:MAG TPA: GNAT family N-acetyltransferase [Propionibacteriaceae bacterium]|nr:GNAT family N-acetyltransferase [Propionibacteriaceae bacterium]